MEEISPDKDQEHIINTVNEHTKRLVKIEELIKELTSRAHITDATLSSVSTYLRELSNKDAPTLAKLSQDVNSFGSGQGNFPCSFLRDIMTSLSIPGMKFIEEKGRHKLHAYLWIFIHIVAFLASYFFIKEEYDQWQNSLVVKTISNNLTFVNEIPFPAVTVCVPMNVKDGFDFEGGVDKCGQCTVSGSQIECPFDKVCTYEEIASLVIASLVCNNPDMPSAWFLFADNGTNSIEGTEFSMYLNKIFLKNDVKIEQFREVIDTKFGPFYMNDCSGKNCVKFESSVGMCTTVNSLSEEDIFKENTVFSDQRSVQGNNFSSYKETHFMLENMIYFNASYFSEPAYIDDNIQIQFSIFVRYNEETAALCVGNVSKGALLAFHNPVEVPFIFNSDIDLTFEETKEIRVIPQMVITEKGLDKYNPMERGCFYSHERGLAMFKHYSEKNCKTECTANCSLQICGCVPYFLPRHNSSVRVCSGPTCFDRSLSCDPKACSCLPDCYSLSYDFEIVKEKKNNERVGEIKMSYKTRGFYATVRVSLTNLAQFMAYCLGIVGVFNGFSVMIILEILYFFAFRLWDYLKSYIK